MNQPPKKMDRYSVQFATSIADRHVAETIRHAKAAEFDEDRVARLKASNCKFCYYIYNSRIGGAAMTERPCGICGKVVMYGSTCTDAVCHDCAKKHSLCVHCGADLELRPNRRKFDWVKSNPLEQNVEKNRERAIAARSTTVTLMPTMTLLPKKES